MGQQVIFYVEGNKPDGSQSGIILEIRKKPAAANFGISWTVAVEAGFAGMTS